MIFGAGNDPRFVISRQTHYLGFVELRVLKCGKPKESITQTRRKSVFRNVDFVTKNQLEIGRQGAADRRFLAAARRRRCPRFRRIVFRRWMPHADDSIFCFGIANDSLDRRPIEVPDCGQECPLVGALPIPRR